MVRRLPPISGAPLWLEIVRGLRDKHGPVHGGAFLRDRRIALDCPRQEFARVFVHELFHFVWVRAGNPARLAFEDLLRHEYRKGALGELGWSAEWRKKELTSQDLDLRTRRWREYCCESFCDTAAWVYSGVEVHEEFTLAARFRERRRLWFEQDDCPQGIIDIIKSG